MGTSVTAVILAGGRGMRMGEADKGLQRLRGRSLVEWVLERIDPQVDELLIVANRNLERYLELGYPVLRDRVGDFAGPLAGLHAGLEQARSELVLAVPCDMPLLPDDLVQRLMTALERSGAEAAVARSAERVHSVVCLCKVGVGERLSAYITSGGRKVGDWHATLKVVYVDFDEHTEHFRNVNTLDDLRELESLVAGFCSNY
jgi:molybdopterin-guanine dinucleotide biosynthesis protein A